MGMIRMVGERSECLAITILGRSHPDSFDYWDGNWLGCFVQVVAGGFTAEVRGDIRAEELALLLSELTPVFNSLSGTANFKTMEDWLQIVITGNGRGSIETACVIRDSPGCGNTLAFRLRLDQTYLPPFLAQLGRVVAEYPVLGSPVRSMRHDNEPVEPVFDRSYLMTSFIAVVHQDPDILGGTPVFTGTRVPFQALIDYLGGGQPLAEFLEDFPAVTRDQAVAALKMAAQAWVVDACSA